MAEEPEPAELKPRGARRPGGPSLSPERISDAALDLVDRHGMEAFSFRTLAAGLGCQAMSIYHYFPSKTHLFEAMLDILIAEVMDYPDSGTWQVRLRAAAAAYRRMALNHPGFFPYFAGFRFNHRTGFAMMERFLGVLQASTLPPEPRGRHFRIVGYFLVGACMDETTGLSKGPSASSPLRFELARRDFPAIMAVGPYLGADRRKADFDAGIEVLIRGIEADLRLSGQSGS